VRAAQHKQTKSPVTTSSQRKPLSIHQHVIMMGQKGVYAILIYSLAALVARIEPLRNPRNIYLI
jgi:hypothetical protein